MLLLVFSLILLLAPYLRDRLRLIQDPNRQSACQETVKGDRAYIIRLLHPLLSPVFPKKQQEPSAALANLPLVGIGKASSAETSPSPLITSEPGRTGITLRWNGSNTVSWYLYDASGQKPLWPHGPFRRFRIPTGQNLTQNNRTRRIRNGKGWYGIDLLPENAAKIK